MTYVFANLSGSVRWRGGTVRLVEGQAWRATDQFVADRPDLFSSVPSPVHSTDPTPNRRRQNEAPPIERATRAPGEKRGGGRK